MRDKFKFNLIYTHIVISAINSTQNLVKFNLNNR